MGLNWRPVGPHPPGVYWRRRAVSIAIPVVVLLLLARGCSGGGTPRPAARAGGSPSPAAQPTASGSPRDAQPAPGAGDCPDSALSVSATTDAPSYPHGATVVFTVTVRNTGPTACHRPLGPGAVELLVTSGTDRIWSSQDCGTGALDPVPLAPGEQHLLRESWPQRRSYPGCVGTRAAVQPGTYKLALRVGDLHEPGPIFHIT